jgi:hypothetical protein
LWRETCVERGMTIAKYFPISVAVFVAVISAAAYFHAPMLPFALILLVGETLVGFQLEDHRIPRFLAELFRAPKHHAH